MTQRATTTIISREIDMGFVGDGGTGCLEQVPVGGWIRA